MEKDKLLLKLEWAIGLISISSFLIIIMFCAYFEMSKYLMVGLIIAAVIIVLVGCAWALKIEQVAGFYHCHKCKHYYVPSYGQVILAMHFGRTRYMKCPKCQKWSWNKKRLSDNN